MSKSSKKYMSRIIGGCAALLVGALAITGIVILSRADSIDYRIGSAAELIVFREKVNAGENFSGQLVALTANIDLTGEVWAPIGSTEENAFAGTFDGENYTIANLRGSSGLFGYLTGTVKNVRLKDGAISSGAGQIGVIANYVNGGRIYSSHVSAGISVTRGQGEDIVIGGIAGYATGYTVIDDCHISTPLVFAGYRNAVSAAANAAGGSSYIGGIIGRADGIVTISNSSSQASVIGAGGGRAGNSSQDQFTGEPGSNGGSVWTGGIAGYILSPASVIANSYNTGTVTGMNGGAGSYDGRQGASYEAAAGGSSYTAGISNNKGIVLNSYNTGMIIGGSGGTGGQGANAIIDAQTQKNTGSGSKGGTGGASSTAGIATGGTVTNSYNQGRVYGKAGGTGGKCGQLATDFTVGSGDEGLSSAAGILANANTELTAANCYNTGKVSGTGSVGSIADCAQVINSYTIEGSGTGLNATLNSVCDGVGFSESGRVPFAAKQLADVLNDWAKNNPVPAPPAGYVYATWTGDNLPGFIQGSGNYVDKEAANALIALADTLRAGGASEYNKSNITAFVSFVDNTLAPALNTPIVQRVLDDLVAQANAQLNREKPAVVTEALFVQVSAGGNHSLAIDNRGNLYTFGLNDYGQLGTGDTYSSSSPIQINPEVFQGRRIIAVAAGENSSIVLDEDGAVWTFGLNDLGQLGSTNGTRILTPSKLSQSVFKDEPVTAVFAGSKHTFALNYSGQLFAWGDNAEGQLGTGDTRLRQTPALITHTFGGSKISALSAGAAHTLAVTEKGELWAWGSNSFGQLGTGTTTQAVIPALIETVSFGDEKIKTISAGSTHSMAVTESGTLFTWGNNDFGQLGTDSAESSLSPAAVSQEIFADAQTVSISAGKTHSLAIDSDGHLWAWGNNANGRLGDSTKYVRQLPIRANLTNTDEDKAVSVTAGSEHSMVIDVIGRVWSWGSNLFGRLGDGTVTDRLVPSLVFNLLPPEKFTDSSEADALIALAETLREDPGVWTSESVELFLDYIDTTVKPSVAEGYIPQDALDSAVAYASSLLKKGKITITLTVDGTETELNYTRGGEVPEEPAVPTKAGHLFVGWYNNSEFSGVTVGIYYWPVFVQSLQDDLSLYARFVPNPVITFLNRETVEASIEISSETDVSEFTIPVPVLENNEFNGWFRINPIDGSRTQVDAANWEEFCASVLESAKSVTLYAVWSPYVFIAFESNGGTFTETLLLPQSTADLTVFAPAAPEKYGYDFNGWFEKPTFDYIFRFDSTQSVPSTNKVLYARWFPKRYTLIYDFNGGYHTDSELTAGHATHDMNYSFDVPLREHYVFMGWTNADGEMLTNNAGNSGGLTWDKDVSSEPVTIVAKWQKRIYEVTFNTDGGTPIEPINNPYDELIPAEKIPQNPTKPFAVFQGWYTGLSGTGSRFNFSADTTWAGNITLYAYWVPDASALQTLVTEMETYRSSANSGTLNQSLYDAFLEAMNTADIILDTQSETVAGTQEIETAYDNLHTVAVRLGFIETSPAPSPSADSGSSPDYLLIIMSVLAGISVLTFAATAVWFFATKSSRK